VHNFTSAGAFGYSERDSPTKFFDSRFFIKDLSWSQYKCLKSSTNIVELLWNYSYLKYLKIGRNPFLKKSEGHSNAIFCLGFFCRNELFPSLLLGIDFVFELEEMCVFFD
jgi:hypothetical protein